MRKLLLFALMLSGLMTSAQTSTTNGNCKAAFKHEVNYKVMTLLPATAINFYDRSEGKVMLWFWDFGDGNTSNEQNPMFVFNHPLSGTTVKMNPYRTVSLTVLTDDSCKSFYSEVINILDGSIYTQPACKARFKYYQTAYDSINGTASFQLTNLSEGDSLKYSWQFDNGKTSTEKEPTITFDIKPSEYKVCLTVTGKNNCTDTFCDAIYITNPDKPIIYPADCQTAFGYMVNYNIKTFAPALVLDFYSKAWPEPTEWKWDFGDGTTSDEANPTHIFNFPLSKDSTVADQNQFRKVCLTVKTTTGCIASKCETINIYMGTTPVDPVQQCHAWFKYEKAINVITIPEVVAYQLKDVSEANVIRRIWQFENGDTSTVAAPLVTFDIFKPTQKVCLTIYTADSCMSTWCETISVSNIKPDTTYVTKPANTYAMRYESSFPPQMSSCAGWAKAQVYMNDSLVNATDYAWSTGVLGQEVKGLCPTQLYTVKAITPDGTYVTGTFVFNSNGTVTEAPFNWWVTGVKDNPFIKYELDNKALTVEWRLCDGTFVRKDSIPLNLINCGGNASNMILKDASGNVVYSENITLKTLATGINPDMVAPSVKLFPNPVTDVLTIQYSGTRLNEMQLEICDVTGRRISLQKFYDVEPGQQISLNVNSLRKGIYLCKMLSDKQIIRIEKFSK